MAGLSIVDDDVMFAETLLWILDKDKRRVRLRFKPAQRHYIANRTRRDLILKARQIGFSTAIQARLFRRVTTSAASTLTMAHDSATTQKMRRMADRFYRNLPESLRPVRKYANAAITSYSDFDSEAEIGTAGSADIGRGGSYTDIHGSEVAFWPDAEKLIAGAMQGGNPYVALESTPNGAQGKFYELCMSALDGDKTWKLFFYPWWWDSDYKLALDEGETLAYTDDEAILVKAHGLTAEQIKWRRAKQKELKHLFAQEYPEDPKSCFLKSGFGYFGNLDAIFGLFKAPLDVTPQQGHRYVGGLDFAQTNDYLALSILDATAWKQVAKLRIHGLSWAEMRRRVILLCKQWDVSTLLAEKNSMGSTNIEAMQEEQKQHGWFGGIMPFDTNNTSKNAIMGNLHSALDEGVLQLQYALVDGEDSGNLYDAQKQELGAFKAMQTPHGAWQLTAPANEHDDTVIALALSWEAAGNRYETGGIYV